MLQEAKIITITAEVKRIVLTKDQTAVAYADEKMTTAVVADEATVTVPSTMRLTYGTEEEIAADPAMAKRVEEYRAAQMVAAPPEEDPEPVVEPVPPIKAPPLEQEQTIDG